MNKFDLKNKLAIITGGAQGFGLDIAKKFLSFINNNLKPLIESKFNIDNLNQSYCGFSFGGLFGLYTLFTSTESFQRYVIGSPSIWWKNKFILDLSWSLIFIFATAEELLPKIKSSIN